jgi:hypothetical protein
VNVATGTLAVHATAIKSSTARGVFIGAGTAVIDEGSAVTGSTGSGILFSGGTSLTVGAATGAQVDISANGGQGIDVAAPGGAGVSVTVTRALIHDNTGDGARLSLANPGGTFALGGGEIRGNGLHGIEVLSAPSATAADAVTIDGPEIHANGSATAGSGLGIFLSGADGPVTATIRNGNIHDNRNAGMVISNGMDTTRETIEDNDVHANNTTATRAAGGLSFEAPSILTAFARNRIHSNVRNQVGFSARPQGAADATTAWRLRPAGTNSCTADVNQIYCYSVGNVGLLVNGATPLASTTVDAQYLHWSHATPVAGTDFTAAAGNTVTIAGNACTAVATCP